jgi:hypothetical protein
MRALSPQDILASWDRGSRLAPPERALALLAVGCPEASLVVVDRLPLDERDHLLLELRVLTFGRRLEAVVACPTCEEWLEFELPADDLLSAPTSLDQGAAIELEIDGVPVVVRVPSSEDLIAARGAGRPAAVQATLLERCVLADVELSSQQQQRAFDSLAERLPHVETLLDLSCAACGHAWQEPFEPGEYLWTEVRAQARRIMLDVHTLALAYGWREADVLEMSHVRRRAYLAMVET